MCPRCRLFDLRRLFQDTKAVSSPSLSVFFLSSSVSLFLSEQANWPDNRAQLHPQLCVGPQQTLLFISLIGHIWHHYFHLGVVQRGEGMREEGQCIAGQWWVGRLEWAPGGLILDVRPQLKATQLCLCLLARPLVCVFIHRAPEVFQHTELENCSEQHCIFTQRCLLLWSDRQSVGGNFQLTNHMMPVRGRTKNSVKFSSFN